MKVLGISGRVGSGKNEVAKILEKAGAIIVDADVLGHELLEHDQTVRERVAFAFPECVDAASGSINRNVLGDIVFSKRERLLTLNQIVHPTLRERVAAEVEKRRSGTAEVIAINAALFHELQLRTLCDWVWAVDADTAVVLKRLRARGWSTPKALAVMSAQRPSTIYIQEADMVIRNNADVESLRHAVQQAYKKFLIGTV